MADFFLNMMLAIILVSVFNLARYILKIRKIIKMNKDNPNIQGISIVNGEIKIIEKGQGPLEKEPEPVKDLVRDTVCNKEIERSEAYRVMKDQVEYFFCSWECREKFLKTQNLAEGND